MHQRVIRIYCWKEKLKCLLFFKCSCGKYDARKENDPLSLILNIFSSNSLWVTVSLTDIKLAMIHINGFINCYDAYQRLMGTLLFKIRNGELMSLQILLNYSSQYCSPLNTLARVLGNLAILEQPQIPHPIHRI